MKTEKELREAGYRKYTGEGIDVYFNLQVCAHSGHCTSNLPEVFNLKKKPWIYADGASVEAVKKLIEGCPSGALQYIEK